MEQSDTIRFVSFMERGTCAVKRGRENVIAGNDCGMWIDSRVEWAELERMAQGA